MKEARLGFSLIELMVVISIAGILMALGAVSYTTAQRKARDATRKGDIKAMQDALEQYYVDNSSVYPGSADCAEVASGGYLQGGIPSDPKPAPTPAFMDYYLVCDSSSGEYCVCAKLESDEGNTTLLPGAAAQATCRYSQAGSDQYFCLSNQQ